MIKLKKNWDLIEDCLRSMAAKMVANPSLFTIEEGKAMDRALRSCPKISDIDVVWARWCYVGEPLGWITRDEIKYCWTGYGYPKV